MRITVLLSVFLSRFRDRYLVKLVEELPNKLEEGTIYIEGSYMRPQYAALQCPCGCGRTVELNLNGESSPCWKVKWHLLGTVSFSPSIWRKHGCGSHFYIRKSRILWCS